MVRDLNPVRRDFGMRGGGEKAAQNVRNVPFKNALWDLTIRMEQNAQNTVAEERGREGEREGVGEKEDEERERGRGGEQT